MKKLLLFTFALITLSCSKDEVNECNCNKTVYEYEQYSTTNGAGLPVLAFEMVELSNEVVPCQDEQDETPNGNGTYFVIDCN